MGNGCRALLAATLMVACSEDNPEFDGPGGSTGATGSTSTASHGHTRTTSDAGDGGGGGGGSSTDDTDGGTTGGSGGSSTGSGDTTSDGGGTGDAGSTSDSTTGDSGSPSSSSAGSSSDSTTPSDATSTTSPSSDTTSTVTSSSDTTSSTSTTAPVPGTIEYVATVAECRNSFDDPDYCRASEAYDTMVVDGDPRWNGYLRFDLDGALAGRTITAVTLRLFVTVSSDSSSDETGEVWEVMPFDLFDLYFGQPPAVGGGPISPDQGAVGVDQEVLFPLPTNVAAPSTGVYLGVFPVTTDGVEYYNLDGSVPPRLIIDYQ